jgi:hypothetical protein
MDFSRTPHQKAAGNLKNKKRFTLDGEVCTAVDLVYKYSHFFTLNPVDTNVNIVLTYGTMRNKILFFRYIFA